MKKLLTTLFLAFFIIIFVNAENAPISPNKQKNKYIKAILENMTLKEMVGQLIMIDSQSTNDSAYYSKVLKKIDSNYVGGVCFFKGTSAELLKLNKLYASHSKIPLFVAIDGEWGLNMRLTDIEAFPMQMTLGALPTNKYSLVYDMGRNIAKQCKSLGININFAPSIDINLNPNNPVINMRSFGQDKYKVALLGEQYIKGLQDEGVMAVIKHFPGHGDTETDSHKATPSINHSKDFIDSVDLYPFRYNIKQGVWGAMVGHLQVDALSDDTLSPASINKDIIDGYLVDKLKFKGLVFTDAMNMKGLTSRFSNGEAEVRALEAGVDIILMPDNLDNAINAILAAVESGRISQKTIKAKCRKILSVKYDMGLLGNKKQYELPSEDLKKEAQQINQSIAENTATVVNKEVESIAMQDSVTLITLGAANFENLIKGIEQKCNLTVKNLTSTQSKSVRDSILRTIPETHRVLTALAGSKFANNITKYGIPDCSIDVLKTIQNLRKDENIVLMFANPYTFKLIDSSFSNTCFIVGYENTAYNQKAVAKMLLGEIANKACLPVTVEPNMQQDEQTSELQFYMDNNIELKTVQSIDSLVLNGIAEKAYPGCQLVMIKDGKTIINKAYGTFTYESDKKIETTTLFDIASLTKVMATTLAVMKLYELDKIDLNDKIQQYLPELKKSNAGKLTIKELLSHYTFLPAVPLKSWLNPKEEKNKTFLKGVGEVKKKDKKYEYSDVHFVLLQMIVENVSGLSLDEFANKYFYSEMGLKNTMFCPLKSVNKELIAPTEQDKKRGLIQGEVHDPTAYHFDGICGNAGLFSTAEDIAKICQMLMNEGVFEGKRYLEKSTIDTFNKRYFADKNVRRGLGFDKPFINGKSSHCSKYASQNSFGHSGFTGTYLWIDPENQSVIVFLSNRVYPSATPNKLAQMNIRTDLNDMIYKL